MGNLQYGDYDDATAAQEKEEADRDSGGGYLKLKVGRTVVRILPPPPGGKTPFKKVYQHFIEAFGKKGSVVCARLAEKKHCVVCDKIDELQNSKSKTDRDMADAMFARKRIFCNVIDRAAPEKGPQVWAFGKTVDEQIVALRTDPDSGGNFVNPENGFDLIIIRTGTGKNDTKYKVQPSRHASALAGSLEEAQEWIDTQKNLDAYGRIPGASKINEMLTGEEGGDGEEEGEEEAAPARRALPQRAAARTPAPAPAPAPPATRSAVAAQGRVVPRTPVVRRRNVEDDAIDTEGEESVDA